MGRSIEHVVTLRDLASGAVLVPLCAPAPGDRARLRAGTSRWCRRPDRRTKLPRGGVPRDPRLRFVVSAASRRRDCLRRRYALTSTTRSPAVPSCDAPLVLCSPRVPPGRPRRSRCPCGRSPPSVSPGSSPAVAPATTGPTTCTGTSRTRAGPPASTRRSSARSPRGATACSPAGRSRRLRRGGCSTATGPSPARRSAPSGPCRCEPPTTAASCGTPLPPASRFPRPVTWAARCSPPSARSVGRPVVIVPVDDASGPYPPPAAPGLRFRRALGLPDQPDHRPVAVAVDRGSPRWVHRLRGDPTHAASFTRDGRGTSRDTAEWTRRGTASPRALSTYRYRWAPLAPFEVESVLMLHEEVTEAV